MWDESFQSPPWSPLPPVPCLQWGFDPCGGLSARAHPDRAPGVSVHFRARGSQNPLVEEEVAIEKALEDTRSAASFFLCVERDARELGGILWLLLLWFGVGAGSLEGSALGHVSPLPRDPKCEVALRKPVSVSPSVLSLSSVSVSACR